MTVVHKLQFDKKESEAIWPHFFPAIEDKHGHTGTVGSVAESAAVEHLTQLFNPKFIIDCGSSPLMQMMGIDLVVKTDEEFKTIDVKGGRSALYWDPRQQEWFITFTDEYFYTFKENKYFFHQSIKGDYYCMYDKSEMDEWLQPKKHLTGLLNPRSLGDTTQYKIVKRHWPEFLKHNLG